MLAAQNACLFGFQRKLLAQPGFSANPRLYTIQSSVIPYSQSKKIRDGKNLLDRPAAVMLLHSVKEHVKAVKDIGRCDGWDLGGEKCRRKEGVVP